MLSVVTARVLASLTVAALVGCGSGSPPEPPNPVEGNIVVIGGDDLTLETTEGESHVFGIGDPTVPVEHLHEHRVQRLPVRITWERRGEQLVATTIADAPA